MEVGTKKFEIYIPKRDDEHPVPFQKGAPLHHKHYFCSNVTQLKIHISDI